MSALMAPALFRWSLFTGLAPVNNVGWWGYWENRYLLFISSDLEASWSFVTSQINLLYVIVYSA